MPQLMPLNWVFSGFMILLVIVSIGVVYSENINVIKVKSSMENAKGGMCSWCW